MITFKRLTSSAPENCTVALPVSALYRAHGLRICHARLAGTAEMIGYGVFFTLHMRWVGCEAKAALIIDSYGPDDPVRYPFNNIPLNATGLAWRLPAPCR